MFVDGRSLDVRPEAPADGSFGHFHAREATVGIRHGDGANVAFADGHCELVIQEIQFDFAAPSWWREYPACGVRDPRQELIWDFTPQDCLDN